MDQDINFQKVINWLAAAAVTNFMVVPYRCTVRELKAICQTSIDADEKITVTYGATTAAETAIGVLTFPTGAGGSAVWAADTLTGDTVLEKDGYLKFLTTASAGSVSQCDINVELDPYAR